MKKNHVIIFLLLINILSFFSCNKKKSDLSLNENDTIFMAFAQNVEGFSKEGIVISDSGSIYNDCREMIFKNNAKQLLRIKTCKEEIVPYHCGIVAQLFSFENTNGWLSKETFHDVNGKLKGESEFDDICITKYTILKPDVLQERMIQLDEWDGNLETQDEKEKIVLQESFNSQNQLIDKRYISSQNFWENQKLLFRP